MQLSPTQIKIHLLEMGVTAAHLARKWDVPKENVSRVINRTPGFVFPEIKQLLAGFLGVPVTAVGREPARCKKAQAA